MSTALLACLALAGCGGSSEPSGVSQGSPKKAPESSGPLTVAAVDGRVGDATAATSAEGLRELQVGRRKTSPDVLKQGVDAAASCADVEILPTAENLPQVSAATLCLVNAERVSAGLVPVTPNAKLDQSSLAHSQDMVEKSYFAHASQDGRDVVDRVKVTGYIPSSGQWTVGENLAWGTGTLATPRGIVQAWMNSEGHRENILRAAFKEAGLGVVLGNPRAADGQGATYTMNFGAVSGESTPAQLASNQAAAPSTSGTTRRTASARRAAAAKRRKACRAKAKRARTSASVRKVRTARCARTARRSRR